MAPTSSHSSGYRRAPRLSNYDIQCQNHELSKKPRQHPRHGHMADTIESCEPQYHKREQYTASPEPGECQEQSLSSVYMQQETLEGSSQFSDVSDPIGPNFSKALAEGTAMNSLHQQQPVIIPAQMSSTLGSDVANQGTPLNLAKLHPSLPNRPVCAEPPPRIVSTTVASSLREKSRSTSNNHATSRLTRDLWDTRREMTALQVRETELVASLRRLDAPRHILESRPVQKFSELDVRLAEVENEIRRERYKRLQAERGLNEIETERRGPFVVPALFRAFLMISEMDG
ncbi:uncharacterized protein HD556DRAFT_826965 [Suillus plorans]|uniref:Uncharacterized protein n=1 Tax=Suillus plorans TaxID=116603 RepID=A0A9P7AGL2_9AGAM|nr:uncharacterized protein HD556DRAFT_826965 [Suillus plorans]KAG1789021.1 hypothetical protein HD556DRAFT_826965 [Suillus plorans]